jgi:hypothetical protein
MLERVAATMPPREKKGSEQFTCNALRGIRRAKGVTGKLF